MAIVYYPKQSVMLRRDTISASYEQIVLSTQPNTILYFGSGSELAVLSASTFYLTASQANTASYLLGTIESSSFALYAISASYAPGASSISASYALTASYVSGSSSVSSSYSVTASYAANITTLVPYSGSVSDVNLGTHSVTASNTLFVSDAAPTNPKPGTMWWDTSDVSINTVISASHSLTSDVAVTSNYQNRISSSANTTLTLGNSIIPDTGKALDLGSADNPVDTIYSDNISILNGGSLTTDNISTNIGQFITVSDLKGDLIGTASYANSALSASYAPGSPSVSASYATTSDYQNRISSSTNSTLTLGNSIIPDTGKSLDLGSTDNAIDTVYTNNISVLNGGSVTTDNLTTNVGQHITVSDLKGNLIGTASYSNLALSASYAPGSPSISASYAITASHALNGGGGSGTSLTTGSTYPITSSWATSSISSSFATTASYYNQQWLNTGSTYPITSSWSANSVTASFSTTASYYNQLWITTGSTYPITSSWATNVISSSFSTTASYYNQQWLITGSSYPITSSWSANTISSSFSVTSSYALVSGGTASYAESAGFAPIAFQYVRVVNGKLIILAPDTNTWYELTIYDDGLGSVTTQLSQSSATGSYNATGSIQFLSSSYAITASYALNGGGGGVNDGGSYNISTSFASSSLSSSYVPGVFSTEYIYVPASSMISNATNGPQLYFFESPDNFTNMAVLAFDSASAESATVSLRLPPYWNHTTPLKAKCMTYVKTSSISTYVFSIKAKSHLLGTSLISGSSWDGSYGTEVSSSITSLKLTSSCESSVLTFTPSNVTSPNDLLTIEIGRKPNDTLDTTLTDVYLTGLMLEFIKTTGSWSIF